MWECIAYNGTEGDCAAYVPNAKVIAQNYATENTSRGLAQTELPILSS